jgi:hypothetical protein
MARVAITNLLAVAAIGGVLVMPAFAVDIRPDPQSTEGSVRIDGHSRELTCDRSENHRGPMTAERRDEVLSQTSGRSRIARSRRRGKADIGWRCRDVCF